MLRYIAGAPAESEIVFGSRRRPTSGKFRGWMKRRLRKGLSRMQSILEEDLDRGKRATVGGL